MFKKFLDKDHKQIESLTQKLFRLVSIATIITSFLLLILSLSLSGLKSGTIFLFTSIECISIVAFGQISIATRYKSRVLAYMMMSLAYTFSLLMRAGTEDLCHVRDSDCEKLPVYLRSLRVILIICFACHTIIAYYNRDSMLTAHNYHYSKHFSRLELINEAESEEQNKIFYILNSFPLCPYCDDQFRTYKSLKLVCIQSGLCSSCFDKLEEKEDIKIIEDWLDQVTCSQSTAIN